MLNPSKADADILDNTVTRCIDYAHESDAGGIEVVNLFPLMSTYPKDLIAADRDGDWDRNAAHILSIASRGGKLVLGFGVNPAKPHLRYALIRLRELLFTHAVKPYALSVTKDGLPKHPLYAKRLLRPVIYEAWPVWTRSSSGAES